MTRTPLPPCGAHARGRSSRGRRGVAVGGDLTLVTDGNFDNVPVENEMIFARANEVVTTPTSATLCKLFFFGFMLGNWPLTTYLD